MWPLPPEDGPAFHRKARPATRPDVELTCRVIRRILDDPRLARERVTVEAQNGVVTLLGTVTRRQARVTAADLARATPGVTDICNRLRLVPGADSLAPAERPDPFDELVTDWDATVEHRPMRVRLLVAAAAATAVATAMVPVLLLPRYGDATLAAMLPGMLVTMTLIRAARRGGPG
ncbi:BON domain-containing protein [Actinoplanes flavus]|uniref:BON domain-containing protein n=1 Tax=Actinoplanes flavus TaxID=2820290 RepID=A0ABS3V042_9ACTN|nr:BON domain-containing protein [Actinoplanes flavus]MBO3744215.1 BON domain-containing protein [Actinoplanes flavus]